MSFDSHAHLDLAPAGQPLQWEARLDRAYRAGIRGILIPGIHPQDWNKLLSRVCAAYQACSKPRLFVALGIHPQALNHMSRAEVDAALERLRTQATSDSRPMPWVALGECGLDYRGRPSLEARERQRWVFREHLRLSRDTKLPITIHCIGAFGDLLEELQSQVPAPSVIHGFTGKAGLARQICALGHYVGVGGMITHPRARHLKESLSAIPPDKLLLETDSPDQTPWERRPAPNEPSFLVDIAAEAARLLGLSTEALMQRCSENARRLFGIPNAG